MARGKIFNRSMSESLASLRSVLVALTLYTLEKQASTLRRGFSDGQKFRSLKIKGKKEYKKTVITAK